MDDVGVSELHHWEQSARAGAKETGGVQGDPDVEPRWSDHREL